MAKYSLVASYYDMFEKNPALRYKNEVEISLPTVSLTTLQAIDKFTASHTKTEIFHILEKELGITGKNQLAVKYQKNKTGEPIYYRVIENHSDFVLCTENNQSDGYWRGDQYIRSLFISQNTLFFLKEWNQLLKAIEKRNLEEFRKIYPYENDDLTYLVQRYISSSYDTDEAHLSDLQLIKKEFSRYKTFRGWIVAKDKKVNYQRKPSIVKAKSELKKSNLKAPVKAGSIEEYTEEFQKDFDNKESNKERGITYQNYQTYQYNTAHLEEDKEEFLEENEMEFEDYTYYQRKKFR